MLVSVWLLRGPLGSGKTTLVRGALRALGYTGVVSSPTFLLRRSYQVHHKPWHSVVHIDAYRLRRLAEEAALDLERAVDDPGCLVFIEWPEKLKRRPWKEAGLIRFSHLGRGRRLQITWPV